MSTEELENKILRIMVGPPVRSMRECASEIVSLLLDVPTVEHKCKSCGEPLRDYCDRCQHLWET